MNNCLICNSPNLIFFDFKHKYLKDCKKVVCKNCNHFYYDSNMSDKDFTKMYVSESENQFINNNQMDILNKSFWLNLSRFQMIKNFVNTKVETIKVLEIGPGFPGLCNFWSIYEYNHKLYVSEPSLSKKNLFKKFFPNILFFDFNKQDSNVDLNAFSNFFDVIILNNVFYYYKDPYKIVSQLKEIAKIDGIILIDILNPKYIDQEYENKIDMRHVFNKDSLKKIFEDFNFANLFLDYFDTDQKNILNQNSRKLSFFDKFLYKFLKLVRVELMKNLIINDTSSSFSNKDGMYLRGVFRNNKR